VFAVKYKAILANSNNVVVITGASTGIGRGIAMDLCKRGYIVFAGVRKEADGQSLVAENDKIIPLIMDVTDHASVVKAAEYVESQIKQRGLQSGLSCLINNAGISENSPVEVMPLEVLRKVLDVNLIAVVDVIQVFMPLLRQAKAARILNMSSINGKIATPFSGAYCASKFGLEAVSDCLRRELAPWKIAVVVIEPGYIRTPIQEKGVVANRKVFDSIQNKDKAKQFYEDYYTDAAIDFRYQHQLKIAEGVDKVAEVVYDAISNVSPATRYMIGQEAFMAKLSAFMPDVVVDSIMKGRYWPGKYLKKEKY